MLAVLRQYFGKVVAFAHETFMIEEIADRQSHDEELLIDFDLWRLKEFGHFLRGVLIERWFTLGRADTAEDKELISQSRTPRSSSIPSTGGISFLRIQSLFSLFCKRFNPT